MTTLLPRADPLTVGLDPGAVRLLIDRLDALQTVHGLILVRGGHVVAEASWKPHDNARPHAIFSVSKSFTSTAVGLAIEEGLFGLDDLVVELLGDDAPRDPSANLRAMRVRHLLTMTSGHADESMPGPDREGEGGWGRRILAKPVEHEPGTRFVYNTGATYLAGLIVQRLTGQRLLDYLRPRVLEPLGITSAAWEQDPDGYDVAGFGLAITIEELAAFGLLYLHRGQWRGRQLIPAEWVDAATSLQVPNAPNESPDWEQGYGFQFWRCQSGAFRADGAFGQFAVVWPEQDLVVAITAGTKDMQSILNVLWSTPLAAGQPALTSPGPVVVSGLALPTPAGAPSSPREAGFAGVRHVVEQGGQLGGITSLTMSRDAEGRLVLTLDIGPASVRAAGAPGGREHTIRFGHGQWLCSTIPDEDGHIEVAGAAAWRDASTLEVQVAQLGTPFVRTLVARLADDHLELTLDQNVAFDDTHVGTAIARPA